MNTATYTSIDAMITKAAAGSAPISGTVNGFKVAVYVNKQGITKFYVGDKHMSQAKARAAVAG